MTLYDGKTNRVISINPSLSIYYEKNDGICIFTKYFKKIIICAIFGFAEVRLHYL